MISKDFINSVYDQILGAKLDPKYKKEITDEEFESMLLEDNDEVSIENVDFTKIKIDEL